MLRAQDLCQVTVVVTGVQSPSCVRLCDPLDCAHQASLSMGFSRQEHWRGLPCSSLGGLPHPGFEPTSPSLQVDSLPLSHQGSWIRQYPVRITLTAVCFPYCCLEQQWKTIIFYFKLVLWLSIYYGDLKPFYKHLFKCFKCIYFISKVDLRLKCLK